MYTKISAAVCTQKLVLQFVTHVRMPLSVLYVMDLLHKVLNTYLLNPVGPLGRIMYSSIISYTAIQYTIYMREATLCP